MTRLFVPSTAIVEVRNDVVIADDESSLEDGSGNTDEDEDQEDIVLRSRRLRRSRILAKQTGDIPVAVVIIKAGNNNVPMYNKDTMRQIVFTGLNGSNGGTNSLSAQMKSCTHNQFRINATNDSQDIFEITVDITPNYNSKTKRGNERNIEAEARTEFSRKYGPKEQYGLIIYCLPGM